MKTTQDYSQYHKIAIATKKHSSNKIMICTNDFELFDTVHFRKSSGEVTYDPAILKKEVRQYLQNLENNGYQIIQRTKFNSN
jgi:hypothetical protein